MGRAGGEPGGVGDRLAAWPGVEVGSPLTGGARAVVRAARRGDERLVVEVSPRSGASLDWELALLRHLREHGLSVPETVPTADGRARDGSVVVQRFLPGGPPTAGGSWRAAQEAVETLHHLTRDWAQRPGAASAEDLLTTVRGADVDLTAMPSEAVALVRACWRDLLDLPAVAGTDRCVVHGDLGTGAFLVDGTRASLIDFDEARVDLPAFDAAALHAAWGAGLDPAGVGARTAEDAALAWEVATCWVVEPTYAVRCLDELYARVRPGG